MIKIFRICALLTASVCSAQKNVDTEEELRQALKLTNFLQKVSRDLKAFVEMSGAALEY